MSMAGTPNARARKAHTQAVAAARARYAELILPAQRDFARAIRPHQEWLRDQVRDADAEFAEGRANRRRSVAA